MTQRNHRFEPMQPERPPSNFDSVQQGSHMASPRTPRQLEHRAESPRQMHRHAQQQSGNSPPSPRQSPRFTGNTPSTNTMSASPRQAIQNRDYMQSPRLHQQQGGSSSSRTTPTQSQGSGMPSNFTRVQNQAPPSGSSNASPWPAGSKGSYSPYGGNESSYVQHDPRATARQKARESPSRQFGYSLASQDFQGSRMAMAHAHQGAVQKQSPMQAVRRPDGAVPLIEDRAAMQPRMQSNSWWARLKDEACCSGPGETLQPKPRGHHVLSSSMSTQQQQKGGCCSTKSTDKRQDNCCDAAPRTSSRRLGLEVYRLGDSWGEEIFG